MLDRRQYRLKCGRDSLSGDPFHKPRYVNYTVQAYMDIFSRDGMYEANYQCIDIEVC